MPDEVVELVRLLTERYPHKTEMVDNDAFERGFYAGHVDLIEQIEEMYDDSDSRDFTE